MANLKFVDTHAHLYDEQFNGEQEAIIHKAIEQGVDRIVLANCDIATLNPMLEMCETFPENCFASIGLHPCYVKADSYKQDLQQLYAQLDKHKIVAVGEIGLDYYWDTTFVTEQKDAFERQMHWALELNQPIIIHTRESMDDAIKLVQKMQNGNLKGVFHCFGGTTEDAKKIIDLGFYMGIGGVVTFKNSNLGEVLKQVDMKHLMLETDAPYLAPVPYRGKRNESSYVPLVAEKLCSIYEKGMDEVAETTTENAVRLFNL